MKARLIGSRGPRAQNFFQTPHTHAHGTSTTRHGIWRSRVGRIGMTSANQLTYPLTRPTDRPRAGSVDFVALSQEIE
jgi:hypothetical protein